jgi:hypothetical protein
MAPQRHKTAPFVLKRRRLSALLRSAMAKAQSTHSEKTHECKQEQNRKPRKKGKGIQKRKKK